MGECFFAGRADTPCEGRLDRMHFIPRQVIRREWNTAQREKERGLTPALAVPSKLVDMLWDPRIWGWGCRGHHGALDVARTLRIARADLPEGVEEFAAEFGLVWWLDREYGERELASVAGHVIDAPFPAEGVDS